MTKQKAKLSLKEMQQLKSLREEETLLNKAAEFYKKGDFAGCVKLYIEKTERAGVLKEDIITEIIRYENQSDVADVETIVQRKIEELETNGSYNEYLSNFLTKIFPGEFGEAFMSSVMKQKLENTNAQQKIKLTEDGYQDYINLQKIHNLQVFFESPRTKTQDSEEIDTLGDACDD